MRGIVLLIVFLTSEIIYSQTKWYFGNGAGVEFSLSGVKPVLGGKIFTNEGCSAAYDENGNLLFYTDGRSVWNKNHELFMNGEGLNGNFSSTQSAIAIPKPNAPNYWYVFTVDAFAGNKGVCYSVINVLSKEVQEKNVYLFGPATEKLAATRHANGKDFWLLAHAWNSNAFYAYLVTEKGIGAPIISLSGTVHEETGAGSNREAIGEMKFSNDGKKLAVAICYRNQNNLEIFHFDNSSGYVSNPQSIQVSGYPYGVCFSPDDSKLYVSFLKGESGIIQYDIATKKISKIVANERENSFGSIQAGLDGKIYIARNGDFLDIISFPEKHASVSEYIHNAVNLLSMSATFGLPNFVKLKEAQSSDFFANDRCAGIVELPFSRKDSKRVTEIVTCEDKFILDAKNPGASYTWSDYTTTRTISIDTSGIYKVIISKNGCVITDSVFVKFKKDLAVFRYLPRFNPGSDFLNSEFFYTIEEVSDFELKIYDSKKKLVFQTQDKEQKWNGKNLAGKLVTEGEYTWKVTFTPICPKGSKPKIQEGKVTVVRNKKVGQF